MTGLKRDVLKLALPALGALIAEPLFLLTDTAMVGHLGAEALQASVGFGYLGARWLTLGLRARRDAWMKVGEASV